MDVLHKLLASLGHAMVSLFLFLCQLDKRCMIYSVYYIFGVHLGKMNSFFTVPKLLRRKYYSDYIYHIPNKLFKIIYRNVSFLMIESIDQNVPGT